MREGKVEHQQPFLFTIFPIFFSFVLLFDCFSRFLEFFWDSNFRGGLIFFRYPFGLVFRSLLVVVADFIADLLLIVICLVLGLLSVFCNNQVKHTQSLVG